VPLELDLFGQQRVTRPPVRLVLVRETNVIFLCQLGCGRQRLSHGLDRFCRPECFVNSEEGRGFLSTGTGASLAALQHSVTKTVRLQACAGRRS
jgi:hypothetical protein